MWSGSTADCGGLEVHCHCKFTGKGANGDIRTLASMTSDSCDLIERILKNEGYRVGTLTDPARSVSSQGGRPLAIVDLMPFD